MTSIDAALRAFAPGTIVSIGAGELSVDVAPAAGGRIVQITNGGMQWLKGHSAADSAMIAWGCYPMLPWAGRIRNGRFTFEGRDVRLPINLGRHAIHGIGFAMPWHVVVHDARRIDLALLLPKDERWPFGGHARQRIEVGEGRLSMELTMTAGSRAMPCVIGWHPWLRKPDHVDFAPGSMYPNDPEGISTLPRIAPAAGPWDHCFVNASPVQVSLAGQCLRLTSDCTHWVVFDGRADATAIEPQSGPPDAFNQEPSVLAAGESLTARMLWEWLPPT